MFFFGNHYWQVQILREPTRVKLYNDTILCWFLVLLSFNSYVWMYVELCLALVGQLWEINCQPTYSIEQHITVSIPHAVHVIFEPKDQWCHHIKTHSCKLSPICMPGGCKLSKEAHVAQTSNQCTIKSFNTEGLEMYLFFS